MPSITTKKPIKIKNNHHTGKCTRVTQNVAFAVNNLYQQQHLEVTKQIKRLTSIIQTVLKAATLFTH